MRRLLAPLVLILLLSVSPIQAQTPDSRGGGSVSTEQELSDEQIRQQMEMIKSIRENVGLFGEIYRQISTRYVDPINPEGFLKAGIDGMLATLDPYTEYIEPENTSDLRIMSMGHYGGVGMQIGTRGPDRILTVISPIEGTPAWRLGLRAGDQILEIDGQATVGFSTSDAADKLRGPAGTQVKIMVRRQGVEKLLEYTITREEIKVNDVSYAGIIDEGVGYVRLTRFSRSAGDEVRSAIGDLLQQGMKGMILDLRSNPGGLLPEALSVAENFVNNGDLIVTTRGRDPKDVVEYRSEGTPALPGNIPLVVMVNEGSASASEIVSGAIQDLDRGVIIGKTSFGKGLVQSVINFRDGTALRITTAKYYTPSGRLIQKVDYFSDNQSIIHEPKAGDNDSLFTTAQGREVKAHGGIEPDISVDLPEVGGLTIALWQEDAFFDFANKYTGSHSDLSGWVVTDEMYNGFLDYLKNRDFKWESIVTRNLQDLRKDAETQGLDVSFMKELDDLEAAAKKSDDAEYGKEEADLKVRLGIELASVLSGNAGRTQAAISHDQQVLEAVKVLKEGTLYAAALSPASTSN
ncbi:MAG: S41 family peptidase [bacterium]